MDFKGELEYTALRIKEEMDKKKMSKSDLAYLTELHRSTIGRILKADLNLSFNVLCLIATALEVKLSDLVR